MKSSQSAAEKLPTLVPPSSRVENCNWCLARKSNSSSGSELVFSLGTTSLGGLLSPAEKRFLPISSSGSSPERDRPAEFPDNSDISPATDELPLFSILFTNSRSAGPFRTFLDNFGSTGSPRPNFRSPLFVSKLPTSTNLPECHF